MKRRFLCRGLTVAVVFFISGLVSAEVSLEYSGAPKFVSLKIANKHLKAPLVITGKETDAIFYQAVDSCSYLSGRPFWTEEVKGGFHGKWRDNRDRVVDVLIKPEDKNYHIKFSTDPNCGIVKWGFSLNASADEYFTGCFEKVVDGTQYLGTEKLSWKEGIETAVDLRGQTVEMFVSNSMALYCPFYFSSRGYGLFTEGTWPGSYDFCKSDKDIVKISFEGPSLKLILYTSADPAEIISAHSLHVGPTIVPPKWVFSCWKWRNDHFNKKAYYDGTEVNAPYCSQVVEDILMMEALDIPCRVYWLDRPWAVGRIGYDDFQWDTDRFPNPVEMISWLDKKGTKTLLWIAPWVSGQMAKVAVEKGYYLKGQKRRFPKLPLIDFTNPAAKRWWQYEGIKKVLDADIAGFKLDRADEIAPSSRDTFTYDRRATRETRNDYPRQYIKAAYDICKKIRGDDFVCMPRAGYSGSSRYCVFWGGDIPAGELGLRCAIIAAQRAAVIGFPIWGSDTAGYRGTLGRENSARWLAFSCFTPIFEVGPIDNRGFWDMPDEPHYDTELLATWRLYAKLHTRLIDYSYKHAKIARRSGMPLIRPLFMMYPDQNQAWEDWQTFLYGSDILVSAVWKNGTKKHTLYLPAGQKWIDAWNTDKTYQGGQKITVDTGFHKIPVFVKQGAEIIKAFEDLQKLYEQSLAIMGKRPDLKELQKTIE